MLHVIKGIVLLAGPLIGYLSYRTSDAVLVGVGVSAIVVMVVLVFERIPLDTLIFGAIGAGGGFVFARLVDWIGFKLENPTFNGFLDKYTGLINILLACMGCMIALSKKGELDLLDKDIIVKGAKNKDVKILDTSVLIDGRICDVVETGFLSGRLIVPRFVLHELQQVADSSDATKRQRGRRGLDILKRLQDVPDINLKIYDKDFPSIKEVDTKILELAKELGGKVATTDFNLNKVATLQSIPVLNINDLAAALKTVVLPGDNITIFLAKEGKEKAQAVGYLDDGTMVVVDDGRAQMGRRVNVHVNSILQTSAGRMIFARASDGHEHPIESIKNIPPTGSAATSGGSSSSGEAAPSLF
jgi:uncharacterized protein YacL